MSSKPFFYLSILLLISSVVCLCLYIVSSVDANRTVYSYNGSVVCANKSVLDFLVVNFTGYSMSPAMVPGNKVLYLHLDNASGVVVGDVIVYRSLGNDTVLVAHRIVSISSDGCFFVKGDANRLADPVVCGGAVVGVVCGVLY